MITVMVRVDDSLAAAIRLGVDFYNRKYMVSPEELWVNLSLKELKLPNGINLVVKARKYVYSPNIIYVAGAEGEDCYARLFSKADSDK